MKKKHIYFLSKKIYTENSFNVLLQYFLKKGYEGSYGFIKKENDNLYINLFNKNGLLDFASPIQEGDLLGLITRGLPINSYVVCTIDVINKLKEILEEHKDLIILKELKT